MSERNTVAARAGKPGASARERVCDFVRAGILRGDFSAGQFLEEAAVGRATGVSRTPVREAFHRLEAERYLDLHPRRGARVRQVTAKEMLELYETRRLLEGFAAAKICRDGRPLPGALRRLTARMRKLGDRDLTAHVELDRLLHRGIVAAACNDLLLEVYDQLRARQECVALAALSADPSRLTCILAEHEALLEALEAHDATAATRLLERHLQPISHVIAQLPGGQSRSMGPPEWSRVDKPSRQRRP